MASKKYCWEIKKCGCQPGGENAGKRGVCPAATSGEYNGVNGGRNAGRICWAVAGTFFDGDCYCTFATKIESCMQCPVFHQISAEEDMDFILRPEERTSRIKIVRS